MTYPKLRDRLLGLREQDEAKRQELVDRAELWEGYHPEMERVHLENARLLEEVLDTAGWPLRSQVGDDGAEAAWLIAVHAIGEPAFQRRCLDLMEEAVKRGEARAAHWAGLVDRIRFNERRPQVYGTILDWDQAGELSPWRLEVPEGVGRRRAEVGLPPLEEVVHRARDLAARERNAPRQPYAERQAAILDWSRRVGWLDR